MHKLSKTVGIIGFGAFGELAASLLPKHLSITIHDPKLENSSTLKDAVECDIIILAVPLNSYEIVLPNIAKHIQPESLLIDVCSVKTKPTMLIKKYLPIHKNILLSHPLFGPQSYTTQQNKQLIVTDAKGETANKVLAYSKEVLKLEVVKMSAEEHDEHMANVHVLTFFIGRACNKLGLANEKITTPSFSSISKLCELDSAHSEELFRTVNNGNPFSGKIRTKLIKQLEEIDEDLKQ